MNTTITTEKKIYNCLSSHFAEKMSYLEKCIADNLVQCGSCKWQVKIVKGDHLLHLAKPEDR